MKLKTLLIAVLMIIAGTTVVSAGDRLSGAGATFPYPVYSAWAFQYYKDTGTRVNYQSIGSGGGVRQIKSRTVDFGASDAPVPPAELEQNGLLQFPAVIGGVVIVVNMDGLENQTLKLSRDVLARIFLGDIRKWDDPAIVALNPGLKLPKTDKKTAENIAVVHRSDGSGTTAIFTTYLSQISSDWKEKVGAGKSVKWPVGIGGKGNEGVANYVKLVKNSIGYVEFAYAKQNNMTVALLENHDGQFVAPSFEAFQAAAAGAQWDKTKGYYLWLTDAPGTDAWPIAGATFILLAKEKPEANKKVVRFYDWAFKNGDAVAKKLIYVPLPESLKNDIRGYWKQHGLY